MARGSIAAIAQIAHQRMARRRKRQNGAKMAPCESSWRTASSSGNGIGSKIISNNNSGSQWRRRMAHQRQRSA